MRIPVVGKVLLFKGALYREGISKMLYRWKNHQYRVWEKGTYTLRDYRYVVSEPYISGKTTSIVNSRRVAGRMENSGKIIVPEFMPIRSQISGIRSGVLIQSNIG